MMLHCLYCQGLIVTVSNLLVREQPLRGAQAQVSCSNCEAVYTVEFLTVKAPKADYKVQQGVRQITCRLCGVYLNDNEEGRAQHAKQCGVLQNAGKNH